MKKRIVALLLVACMIFVLAACGEKNQEYSIYKGLKTFDSVFKNTSFVASIGSKNSTDENKGLAFVYSGLVSSSSDVEKYVEDAKAALKTRFELKLIANKASTEGYTYDTGSYQLKAISQEKLTKIKALISQYFPKYSTVFNSIIESVSEAKLTYAYAVETELYALDTFIPCDAFVVIELPGAVKTIIVIPSLSDACEDIAGLIVDFLDD